MQRVLLGSLPIFLDEQLDAVRYILNFKEKL